MCSECFSENSVSIIQQIQDLLPAVTLNFSNLGSTCTIVFRSWHFNLPVEFFTWCSTWEQGKKGSLPLCYPSTRTSNSTKPAAEQTKQVLSVTLQFVQINHWLWSKGNIYRSKLRCLGFLVAHQHTQEFAVNFNIDTKLSSPAILKQFSLRNLYTFMHSYGFHVCMYSFHSPLIYLSFFSFTVLLTVCIYSFSTQKTFKKSHVDFEVHLIL